MKQLLEELKRRNVFRAGAAYLVAAWLLAQVAALLVQTYEAPSWVMRAIVGALALGLPATLLFAWVYEFTPRGVLRDAAVAADSPARVRTSRRLDRAIIVLLTVALLYFAVDKIWLSGSRHGDTGLLAVDTTVAVLPFTSISTDAANEVLADGIAETLITMLAQVRELRVIGRVSSFSYKGREVALSTIGEQLGAGALLTGSVQRAAGRLRVTAQLVSAADGAQLWAETFDRPTDEVFAIQDEVARRVVDALKITLAGRSGPGSAGTHNFAAYELYLRGSKLMNTQNAADVAQAIDLFKQATELDPNYARAWGALAYTYVLGSGPGGNWGSSGNIPYVEASAAALQAARKAVELAPDSSQSHVVMFAVLAFTGQEGADESMAKALELAPQDPYVLTSYASRLRLFHGRYAEAAAIMRRVLVQDPRNFYARLQAAAVFEANGDVAGSLAQSRQAILLEPESAQGYFRAAMVLQGALGRRDEALRFWGKAVALDPANVDSRSSLILDLAAIGAGDLARRELDKSRSVLDDADYRDLLAQVEDLLAAEAPAADPDAEPPALEELDRRLVDLDDSTIVFTQSQAQSLIARLTVLEPDWFEQAMTGDSYAPICLLAWSGDRERANALLEVKIPVWRKLAAYSAATGNAGRYTRMARALACTGRGKESIIELETLLKEGYHAGGWQGLRADHVYDAIRAEPRFRAIVARLRSTADAERKQYLARPELAPSDIDALEEPAPR